MIGDDDIRTCFVIMPFGTKKDVARRDKVNFDRVYSRIIQPAIEGLKDRGLKIRCIRADKIQLSGLIHERMIAQIAEADVALADITSQNPNVYYELGVRHALRNRVTVMIRRKGTKNPFNVGGMTTIEYDVDERSAEQARDAIANFVANGLLSGAKDSLVYTVLPGLRASLEPKPITETRWRNTRSPASRESTSASSEETCATRTSERRSAGGRSTSGSTPRTSTCKWRARTTGQSPR
jgi:hypothetical protein